MYPDYEPIENKEDKIELQSLVPEPEPSVPELEIVVQPVVVEPVSEQKHVTNQAHSPGHVANRVAK